MCLKIFSLEFLYNSNFVIEHNIIWCRGNQGMLSNFRNPYSMKTKIGLGVFLFEYCYNPNIAPHIPMEYNVLWYRYHNWKKKIGLEIFLLEFQYNSNIAICITIQYHLGEIKLCHRIMLIPGIKQNWFGNIFI